MGHVIQGECSVFRGGILHVPSSTFVPYSFFLNSCYTNGGQSRNGDVFPCSPSGVHSWLLSLLVRLLIFHSSWLRCHQ